MAKNKSVKSSQQYKEDIIFFRMCVLFMLVCAAVVFIFRLKSKASNAFYRMAHQPLFISVLGIIFLLTIAYWAVCRRKKKDESEKTFASINYVAVMAYIFIFCLYWGSTLSPRYETIITLTIALPLLYFIHHIYKKDFFVFSVSNLVFAAAIWFFFRSGLIYTIAAAVTLALSAYCCYFGYRLSKKYRLSDRYHYRFEPICISFIITVLLIVFRNFITLPFLTSSVVWMIVLFQYLAGGIYYTIKLLREA